MNNIIKDDKLVELSYEITDKKTNESLVKIEYPIGYVHGSENPVLASDVTSALSGKAVGDVIQVPIDCTELYGERDETLVFTDAIENVPEDYHELGATISMENSRGEAKNFIVTRFDDKTLTVDGNNPLCGREVIFNLKVLSIRDATEEEIVVGGKIDADPDLEEILSNQKTLN